MCEGVRVRMRVRGGGVCGEEQVPLIMQHRRMWGDLGRMVGGVVLRSQGGWGLGEEGMGC